MKKYAVYSLDNKSDNFFLSREFDTLTESVKEAYRMARYSFHNRKYANGSIEFAVGINVGVKVSYYKYKALIRFVQVNYFTISGDGVAWINMYNGAEYNSTVKWGIKNETIHGFSKK